MKEDILRLAADGANYTQIQKKLGCSKGTISYHLGDGQKAKTIRRRRLLTKSYMIFLRKSLGNKCSICGYARCTAALEFHHKNPRTKDRTYGGMQAIVSNCSFDKAKKEAEKCVLLCSNCHREYHAGLITI